MAIKYVCDVCGKELKESEMQAAMTGSPLEWAGVSISFPSKAPTPDKPLRYYPVTARLQNNKFYIVCSQACAEGLLDVAQAELKKAFEKLADVQAQG